MPDGTERPWDWDTIREVAKLLTVDKNGKDATQDGFDPENIVQWGLEPQRDDLRQTGAYWGPGQLAGGADGTTVEIPDAWVDGWKAFYDGMWTDHYSMTGPQFESDELNPSDYPFFTGNVSMSPNYLWSTYGVGDSGDDWDLAATPSYNGTTTAAFNADTFRIHKDTKHPEEAFEALTYLLGDASEHAAHDRMAACPPGRRSRTRSSPPSRRASRTRSTGTWPRRASTTPTCRTSSRTCRRTTSHSTS